MSDTIRKKKKLAHRVARIRGQVAALARALDGEAECGDVLRLIASARGAMDSLVAEVIEGHILDRAFRGARAKSKEGEAAQDLVDIIRSYLNRAISRPANATITSIRRRSTADDLTRRRGRVIKMHCLTADPCSTCRWRHSLRPPLGPSCA
jgi:FrmR/RcnR family transcriptional regulator, repressor of rcnA expression